MTKQEPRLCILGRCIWRFTFYLGYSIRIKIGMTTIRFISKGFKRRSEDMKEPCLAQSKCSVVELSVISEPRIALFIYCIFACLFLVNIFSLSLFFLFAFSLLYQQCCSFIFEIISKYTHIYCLTL